MDKKINRVLSLSMRPKNLSDMVGQTDLTSALESQFKSGRVPHFFILSGPVGAGKTTLARILALCIQKKGNDFKDLDERDWNGYKKHDISEINAANKNGVDDIRHLVETMRFKPIAMTTENAKVVILDEAHQLTKPAQNALITETEDVADHVFYIFCTSAINNIIPALRRRAYLVTPRPLDKKSTEELLIKAAELIGYTTPVTELVDALDENGVTSPGLVLQAAERFFAGLPAVESVSFSESNKFDSMGICRAVSVGNWASCCSQMKDVVKNDVYMLRCCILGYLKAILIKTSGTKAVLLSKAINQIAASSIEDSICLPSLFASLCLACETLSYKPSSTSSTSSTSAISSSSTAVKSSIKPTVSISSTTSATKATTSATKATTSATKASNITQPISSSVTTGTTRRVSGTRAVGVKATPSTVPVKRSLADC